MDAAAGAPGRPLNWLPAGLTSLILSLERTDSLAVQLKAFSVTQAVKSLLSTKTSHGDPWANPNPPLAKGFNRSFSLDALRELAKPAAAANIHGIAIHSYPARIPCWCDGGDEYCDCNCGYGGCADLDCASCESCASEEEFDCEYDEHHAPELQYQWGFPLAGSLMLSGPTPYSPKCSNGFYQARRDTRSQRRGAAAEGTDWAPRLGDSFRQVLGGSAVNGQDEAKQGRKHAAAREAPSNWNVNVAYKKRDADDDLRRRSRDHEQVQTPAESAQAEAAADSSARVGGSSGCTEQRSEQCSELRKPVAKDNVGSEALPVAKQRQGEDAAAGDANLWLPGRQMIAAEGERAAVESSADSADSEEITLASPSPAMKNWNFRMGQNAIAGAVAGGFVSLCLHPIDTLKTVVQAQTGGSRNLLPILSSIISQRGIKGLYRGLGSNLASSAPTSAIYTLSYEAFKAGLLLHLPKDMSALAHCAAGGCASLATSIVYTPSECVKQQMQVNSLYRNSWLAFTGLLKQGGLPMLYTGWGAVLCRNVPQSVIKFYTYEALKLWVQGGKPSDTPLSTVQALAIGGVAGSTAAFVTTPFDVVKTRLQTQVPGALRQYNGVFHAFQSIAANEGVAGLYRGLVPRLVIYVTQGALFFASYEFIKRLLAVEAPPLQIKTGGCRRKPAPIPVEST